MPKIKAFKKGFTIIELMVAIFVMTVGLTGIFGLIQQTVSFIFVSSSKLTASYLAQEGIEIARNIADTNLIKGNPWDEGLLACGSVGLGCKADYNDSTLASYNNEYLKFDGGFYNHDSGTNTKFQRKITIDNSVDAPEGWSYLKINVQVSWQEKTKPYQVTAEERLYNWRQ